MISFIVATIGRPSLADTLASIDLWPGDELIVIGAVADRVDGAVRFVSSPPGGDWGSTERNIATPLAKGRYLAHIDDDDVYAPGHRALMDAAMREAPDRLAIFKMRYPNGYTLWKEPAIRWGNVGTPMLFMPNIPAQLGRWGEAQDCGDLRFMQTMKFPAHEIAWRSAVIAHVAQVHR